MNWVDGGGSLCASTRTRSGDARRLTPNNTGIVLIKDENGHFRDEVQFTYGRPMLNMAHSTMTMRKRVTTVRVGAAKAHGLVAE